MSTGIKVVDLATPQLLGYFMNWALISALSVQVFFYHLLFRKDSLYLRCFVYGMFVLDWVQSILVTVNAFNKFAWHFGDVANMAAFGSSWFTIPVLGGVISVAVQFFYARRVWLLSKSRVLTAIICALALMQGSAAIVTGIRLKNIHSAIEVKEVAITSVGSVWLGGSALVDIVIAVSMTVFLLKAKTGIQHSDFILNKLARLVIESGMLTAGIAVIEVSLYGAFPGTSYYEAPAHILSKLYVNTMLTSLNNRAFIQRTSPHVSDLSSHGNNGAGSTAVRVDVLRETRADSSIGEYPMTDCVKGSGDFEV